MRKISRTNNKTCEQSKYACILKWHEKELEVWQEVKVHSEENVASNPNKISNLKTALEEMQTCTEMNTEHIKILLAANRERFTHQLKEALDRGWTEWVR